MIPEHANEVPFDSLPNFVSICTSTLPGSWVFRGHADVSWSLRPSAGRQVYPHHCDDLGFFARWRHQAVAYQSNLPEHDLECLAYAQHYGLATRLLDWTANPLVALYFAVESGDNEAVVYAYHVGSQTPLLPNVSFSDIEGVHLYRSRPFDRRIAAQQGVFTYHSNPSAQFVVAAANVNDLVEPHGAVIEQSGSTFPSLTAIRVPAINKYGIRRQLRDIGITRSTLFPDLDGLSKYINWTTSEEVNIYNSPFL